MPCLPRQSADGSYLPAMMQAEENLYLEVFINDYRIGKLASFHRYADGCLTIASEDLREFDLKGPNEAIHDGGICLERMPGVTYRYDAAGQTIHFAVTDEARIPLVLDARRRRPEMAPAQEYPVSAVFNYALFANANSDDLKITPSYQGVSATVDMHLFSGYGAIDQSATMNSTASELTPNAVRLDSRWSYEDPAKVLTYVAGDIVSASLNWTRSVRMGGVQLRRDFTLRPDLITSPLPQVSGSAAVPSTIELYANQSRALSKEFSGGPFTIDNIPTITGPGTIRLVMRDASGKEIVSEYAYYASANLLAQGVFDYAAETGFVRRFYGLDSNNYDGNPVGSASFRYGVTPRLTAEGHAEGGDGLLNLGSAVNFGLGIMGWDRSVSRAASSTEISEHSFRDRSRPRFGARGCSRGSYAASETIRIWSP